MKKAICLLSVVPIRAEDADTSEIVSQLLFGEAVEIIEYSTKPNWIKIKNIFDGYEGWVDPKQVQEVENLELPQTQWLEEGFVEHNGIQKRLSLGSAFLPKSLGWDMDCYSRTTNYTTKNIEEVAYLYLGVPYLWGGRSQYGIDCSGFTQQVYKLCGIKLPRDASQQALVSEGNIPFTEYKEGDLAFFHNTKGNIIHVGIMLADNKIIHAHGEVKINEIDQKGILFGDGSYSHGLTFVKRFF